MYQARASRARGHQTAPAIATATGSIIIAMNMLPARSATTPSKVGDHRSPNRWIAKIAIAIELARNSGGTPRNSAALIGEVPTNRPSSTKNPSTKNGHATGDTSAATHSGAASATPIAQILSRLFTARRFAGSSYGVSGATMVFAFILSAHRPPITVPMNPAATVINPNQNDPVSFFRP